MTSDELLLYSIYLLILFSSNISLFILILESVSVSVCKVMSLLNELLV